MRKFIRNLISVALLLAPTVALAASTVNPTVPASNSPLTSAPIRNNFLGAYNDINGVESKFNSTSAPGNLSAYQDWVDTTTATAPNWKVYVGGQWVSVGSWNCTGSPCTWSLPSSVFPTSVAISTNLNAASLQAAQTGTLFQGQQASGTIARAELDSFGAISSFSGVIAGGTKASPTAVTSGTQLTGINAYAYNGASFVGPIVSYRTYAGENIASGHQGSQACIATTPTASTTLADHFCQNPSGGTTIGSPTGGDEGADTLNAAGSIYVNNVILDSISASNTLSNKTLSSPIFTGTVTTPITGSTQCLQVNSSGVLAGSGAGCGGASASTPTYETLTSGSGATYTTLASARELLIRCVGGGGGSGGTDSGPGDSTGGGTGGTTTFNSINAVGGGGSSKGTTAVGNIAGGVGGTGGTGTASFRSPGNPGQGTQEATNTGSVGGTGGGSLLGGGGTQSAASAANTGGGGGGSPNGTSTGTGSPGGGGGEYFEYVIASPAASYTYTIGAGGSAGSVGTGGLAGKAGGSGVCRVTTFY